MKNPAKVTKSFEHMNNTSISRTGILKKYHKFLDVNFFVSVLEYELKVSI